MVAPAELAMRARTDRMRLYPPLLAAVAVTFLAIYALPSALNLPQANPGQVAEYAPVPGQSNTAPPNGNLAALGLGDGGAPSGGSAPPPSTAGGIKVPTGYDCVGNPPRQTADPLSPPCVPAFSGSNGGATWQGVSGTTINVLFHFQSIPGLCQSGIQASNGCVPPQGYYDIGDPIQARKWFLFQDLNDWMRYFNNHYQTYRRLVHFWAYLDDETQNSCSTGQANCYTETNSAADAAKNWNDKHPFAAFDEAGLYSNTYSSVMAKHQTLNFGGQASLKPATYFRQYPGFYWSFGPNIERIAQDYATYVCQRIWNKPVSFDGNSKTGSRRKLGVLLTDDPRFVDTTQYQQRLSLQYMQQDCGITSSDYIVGYFHYNWGDASGPKSGWGVQNMSYFQNHQVTTVLMPGGEEFEDYRAADQLKYYPEWVLEGDGLSEGSLGALAQNSNEFGHAVIVTPQTLQDADGEPVEPACLSAILEVQPTMGRQGLDVVYACLFFYDDIRQLFTGIQLAGPHLTPDSMNEGFHAIPPKPSTSSFEPSCFYDSGDYTCVKDAVLEWWDPTAKPENTTSAVGSAGTGCWRMWRAGARYLPNQWPSGDGKDGWSRSRDVCNLYEGGYGGPTVTNR